MTLVIRANSINQFEYINSKFRENKSYVDEILDYLLICVNQMESLVYYEAFIVIIYVRN